MNTAKLLSDYGIMFQLSQRMLDAARQGEWERLVELEQERSMLVDALRVSDKCLWLDSDAKRKSGLIHTILVADAEIKSLVDLRMSELRHALGSADTERKLNKAYNVG